MNDNSLLSEFKIGDVVRLKSGGPKMTVQKVNPDAGYDIVICGFFKKNSYKGLEFYREELELATTLHSAEKTLSLREWHNDVIDKKLLSANIEGPYEYKMAQRHLCQS